MHRIAFAASLVNVLEFHTVSLSKLFLQMEFDGLTDWIATVVAASAGNMHLPLSRPLLTKLFLAQSSVGKSFQ